ncbi:hypothetical protein J6590_027961 [Homalodisca vitripennis]|nr:hypothetical protein J6590_027961 [Homalodisca vitripennis]
MQIRHIRQIQHILAAIRDNTVASSALPTDILAISDPYIRNYKPAIVPRGCSKSNSSLAVCILKFSILPEVLMGSLLFTVTYFIAVINVETNNQLFESAGWRPSRDANINTSRYENNPPFTVNESVSPTISRDKLLSRFREMPPLSADADLFVRNTSVCCLGGNTD